MNPKILLVDDEPHVLSGITRQLGDSYDMTSAVGPFEGLEAIGQNPEFALVVADMRMPGMDGIQFLAKVRELSPDSIRMMLTGNADHNTAVKAVNEGNVFRFLNKPADKQTLSRAVDDCLEQYRLIAAEKELLEKTLSGSIKVLVEILATVNPGLFGKAQHLKVNASKLATALNAPDVWQIELAAMLCQIGSVALPSGGENAPKRRSRLEGFETPPVERIPLIGSSLINKIPRLEAISDCILYQDQHFDGTGFPGDGRSGEALPLGARILKVLKDYDSLTEDNSTTSLILKIMGRRIGWYDPAVLQAAADTFAVRSRPCIGFPIAVGELVVGDTIGSELTTTEGVLLASVGQLVSEVGFARITTYVGMGLLDPKGVVYVTSRVPEAA